MIVHSPALSSAYGSMREGCWSRGMYTGTHDGREHASPTEVLLCSRPLNRRKRCTSARNSVKHDATVNSISRRIRSRKCRRAPNSRPNGRWRNMRGVSSVQSITIEQLRNCQLELITVLRSFFGRRNVEIDFRIAIYDIQPRSFANSSGEQFASNIYLEFS